MSNPAKPSWPAPGAFPFMPFAMPAATASTGQAPSSPLVQPLMQGLSGGVDLIKQFWGSLPGGTQLPGFLVPTVDLDELDKRISDLRAAESWVEVNLNMLRATIQGLEVQRHTIAAIQSLSTMADKPATVKPSSHASVTKPDAPGAALPAGWPVPATPDREAAPTDEHDIPDRATAEPNSATGAGEVGKAEALSGLAAGNWLGYLQDQFAKVAQAALASSAPTTASTTADGTAGATVSTTKRAAKTTVKRAASRTPKRATKR